MASSNQTQFPGLTFEEYMQRYSSADAAPRPPTTPIDSPARGLGESAIESRGRIGAEAARTLIPPLVHGFVEMARDVKNAVGNFPKIAVASFKDMINPLAFVPGGVGSPAMEVAMEDMGPEQIKSTIRGAALVNATAVAGVAGSATRTIGREIIAQSPMLQASPRVAGALLGASSGMMEGLAFAEAFGPLHQLTEKGKIDSDMLFAEVIGIGLFGTVMGAGFGMYSAGRATLGVAEDELVQRGLRDSVAERTDLVLRETLPGAPPPGIPEELVSQVAAGVTNQGVLNSGLPKALNDLSVGALNFLQTRFPQVKGLDASTWGLGLRTADARVFGAWFGQRGAEVVEHGLTTEESTTLWTALTESRFNQVRRDILEQAQGMKPGERVLINNKATSREALMEMADNVPQNVLTPEQRVLLEMSPNVKRGLDRYSQMILSPMTQMRTRNGLRSFVETDLPFIPLVRATPEMIEAGVKVLQTHPMGAGGVGERVVGEVTAATTPGAKRALGQANAYVVDGKAIMTQVMGREAAIDRKNELIANIIDAPWSRQLGRGESHAKTIMYQGREVPAAQITIRGNPEVIKNRFGIEVATEASMMDDMAAQAFKEEMTLGAPEAKALGPGQKSLAPPKGTALTRAGEAVEVFEAGDVVGIEGMGETIPMPGEMSENILGRYEVPKAVADMVKELTTHPRNEMMTLGDANNPLTKAWFAFQDFNTGLLLASPVEMTAHSLRIWSRLASNPHLVDPDQAAVRHMADKFALWFGPRANAMKEVFSVYSTPEDFAMEAMLSEIPGALTPRAFESEIRGTLGKLARRVGNENAAEATEIGRKALFGLPKQVPVTIQGLISGDIPISGLGLDIRARIVGAKAFKRFSKAELGREPSRAEYSEFLQQFGSYSETVQSNFQAGLRKTRLSPFAANLSTLASEVRSFVGGTNLPKTMIDEMTKGALYRYKAEVLMRMTIPTAITAVFTQKALTGKWIWENEAGHKDDILVGYLEDGRGVYIPITSFEPDFARGASILGARALMESIGQDLATPGMDVLQNLANTAISYTVGAAPGTQAAFGFATGSAPFFTSEGKVLQVASPQPTDALAIKNRFLLGAGESNPTLEALLGLGPNEGLSGSAGGNFIRIINALTPGMQVGNERLMAGSSDFRADKARMGELVFDRVTNALDKMPGRGERIRFYREQVETFPVPRVDQLRAFREMLDLDTRLQVGQRKNFVRAQVAKSRR